MPKVPWPDLSELRHELSGERTVIAGCMIKVRKCGCVHSKGIIQNLKRIDYNIQRIQTKLDKIIEEGENGD